jgi:hypothetical protein
MQSYVKKNMAARHEISILAVKAQTSDRLITLKVSQDCARNMNVFTAGDDDDVSDDDDDDVSDDDDDDDDVSDDVGDEDDDDEKDGIDSHSA